MDRLLYTLLVALLITGLGLATWQSGRLLRTITPRQNLLLSPADNLLRLFLILVCVVLGVTIGPGVGALGWDADNLAANVVLGVLVALALAPLMVSAGAAAIRRWGPLAHDDRLLRAIIPNSRREWVLVALAMLPAALLEELLFRSMPLAGLAWLVSPWVLMWPLALIFGAFHWPQGQWGVLGTALVAVVLSALFLWTGSIWSAVVAHWVMNVLEITLARRRGIQPLRAEAPLREEAPPR